MISLTASSQTIEGLDRQQKEEIASTLVDYPLVLQELEYTSRLLMNRDLKIAQLRQLNSNLELQLSSSEIKNGLTQKQLDIANKQLEAIGTGTKDKLSFFTWGMAAGILTTLLITVL